jgi:hypothetical protein
MKGVCFHGDKPGHVDLSFCGFLAGCLYSETSLSQKMIEEADLGAWLEAMKTVVPLSSLFPSA